MICSLKMHCQLKLPQSPSGEIGAFLWALLLSLREDGVRERRNWQAEKRKWSELDWTKVGRKLMLLFGVTGMLRLLLLLV